MLFGIIMFLKLFFYLNIIKLIFYYYYFNVLILKIKNIILIYFK
jgi:hypothetical protein